MCRNISVSLKAKSLMALQCNLKVEVNLPLKAKNLAVWHML